MEVGPLSPLRARGAGAPVDGPESDADGDGPVGSTRSAVIAPGATESISFACATARATPAGPIASAISARVGERLGAGARFDAATNTQSPQPAGPPPASTCSE